MGKKNKNGANSGKQAPAVSLPPRTPAANANDNAPIAENITLKTSVKKTEISTCEDSQQRAPKALAEQPLPVSDPPGLAETIPETDIVVEDDGDVDDEASLLDMSFRSTVSVTEITFSSTSDPTLAHNNSAVTQISGIAIASSEGCETEEDGGWNHYANISNNTSNIDDNFSTENNRHQQQPRSHRPAPTWDSMEDLSDMDSREGQPTSSRRDVFEESATYGHENECDDENVGPIELLYQWLVRYLTPYPSTRALLDFTVFSAYVEQLLDRLLPVELLSAMLPILPRFVLETLLALPRLNLLVLMFVLRLNFAVLCFVLRSFLFWVSLPLRVAEQVTISVGKVLVAQGIALLNDDPRTRLRHQGQSERSMDSLFDDLSAPAASTQPLLQVPRALNGHTVGKKH